MHVVLIPLLFWTTLIHCHMKPSFYFAYLFIVLCIIDTLLAKVSKHGTHWNRASSWTGVYARLPFENLSMSGISCNFTLRSSKMVFCTFFGINIHAKWWMGHLFISFRCQLCQATSVLGRSKQVDAPFVRPMGQ